MKKCIHIVLLLSCVILLSSGDGLRAEEWGISKEKFSDNFQKLSEGNQNSPLLNGKSRHLSENIHYVLIAGFLSFQQRDYFTEQIVTLEQFGVPRRNIHLLKPTSRYGVDQSVTWLKRELENLDGKLVIVAHSKGGLEAFSLAIKHAPFVHDRVDDIYIIQGAMGGSPFADLVLDPKFDWSIFEQFTEAEKFTVFLERVKALVPKYLFRKGLFDLQTRVRREQNAELLDKYRDSLEVISPKIHYLSTQIEDASKYKEPYRTRSKVLSILAGKNDGVVTVESQSVTGVGGTIFNTEAAHGDFTSQQLSVFDKLKRVALIKSIATAAETKLDPSHPSCPWVLSSLSK